MKTGKYFTYILGIGTLIITTVNAEFISCPQMDCSNLARGNDLVCLAHDPFHFERSIRVHNLGYAFQSPVTLIRAMEDQTCEYSIGNEAQVFRVKKLLPINPCAAVSVPTEGFNCD